MRTQIIIIKIKDMSDEEGQQYATDIDAYLDAGIEAWDDRKHDGEDRYEVEHYSAEEQT